MKPTFLKKPLSKAKPFFAGLGAAVAVVALLSGNVMAQFFNPSVLTEYNFPTPPGAVAATNHSFTYTMSHIAFMTNFPTPPPPPPPYTPAPPTAPQSDLSVHCWDNGGGVPAGVGYLNTATGAGTPPPAASIYDQGFVPYPGTVRSLEASLMQDRMGYNMFVFGTDAPWYVIVSYYNSAGPLGPGHYMDTYIWNQPPPNGPGGLTLVGRVQLSTIKTYTPVKQDGHNTYGFCITWENPTAMAPGTGVNFVYGFMNPAIAGPSVSPVYLLPGTGGQKFPDVAFTHDGAGLNLQFVYYRKVGANMNITQSTIPMQLGPGWAAPPAPVINDVNIVPWPCASVIDLKVRIDAPDHGFGNLAYSYTLPPGCGVANRDIYVRYNNAGPFATYCLTNGTMGNLPCDLPPTGFNDWPFPSFDQTTTDLNVQWYTQYQNDASSAFFTPNAGGYIGLRMNNVGAIVSPLDYLQVAEAATGSNTLASATPTIASSRQDDRTNYQFVTFANTKPAGSYMVVKDRPWTSATFKGTSSPWASLYSGSTAAQSIVNARNEITAYPNPFSSDLHLSISAGLLDEELNVVIEDISGKVIDKFACLGSGVNTSLGRVSAGLTNGMYLIKVQSVSGDINKVLKVQKLASE